MHELDRRRGLTASGAIGRCRHHRPGHRLRPPATRGAGRRPFQLLFENRESAPHNVRIYDEVVDQPLFVGEVFGGPGSRTYDVPSIPAGTFKFLCDVHPDMVGTLTAR